MNEHLLEVKYLMFIVMATKSSCAALPVSICLFAWAVLNEVIWSYICVNKVIYL